MSPRNSVKYTIGAVTLAIILGCGGGGGGTGTASIPTTILFSSNESGAFYQVHKIGLDGSIPTQLTLESPNKVWPIAIDGGAKVLFFGNFSTQNDIYITDPATTVTTNLSDNPAQEVLFDYHPGIGKILFESNRAGTYDLYTMNLDGSDVTQITTLNLRSAKAHFSKDGTKILYMSHSGDWYIRVCNVDGSNNLAISGNDGGYSNPRISPDGTKVLYEFYNTTTNDYSIGVRDITGLNSRMITDDSFEDLIPQWSPDGSKIVFARQDISNNRNIMIINADGTGLAALTNDTLFNDLPTFSLDGNKIIFTIGESSDSDLATMNLDGSGKTIIHNTDRSINYIRPF